LSLGAFALLLEDAVGVALLLGVEQHHAAAQFLHRLRRAGTGSTSTRLVRIEADVVQAAEGRGVLVLLADGLAQHLDLDPAGLLGQVLGADDLPLVGIQRLQHAHGQGARRAHAGAAWHVAHGGDLQVAAQAGEFQRLAHQFVLEVADLVHDLVRV
jgi:hypothetical protein